MAIDDGVERNQNLTIGITVTCLALAILSYVARLYARMIGAAKLWWDDYWMALVLLICISMSVGDFLGLTFGSGQHQDQLDVKTLMNFQKNLFVYMLFWATGVFSVKIGILMFYWRVFSVRSFRMSVIAVFALTLAIYLSNFFTFIFQCLPVARFWNNELPGSCINQIAFYEASAIINVVGDIIVLFLPLPVVWGLQTSSNKKWALSFLFLLGAFVCVASIFRIIAVIEIDTEDFTFSNVAGGIWSTVEVELGFICANLPAVRPLIVRWFGKESGTATYGYGYGGYGHSHGDFGRSASNHLHSQRRGDRFELMQRTNSDTSVLVKQTPNDSLDEVPPGSIHVRTELEVTDGELPDQKAAQSHATAVSHV